MWLGSEVATGLQASLSTVGASLLISDLDTCLCYIHKTMSIFTPREGRQPARRVLVMNPATQVRVDWAQPRGALGSRLLLRVPRVLSVLSRRRAEGGARGYSHISCLVLTQ